MNKPRRSPATILNPVELREQGIHALIQSLGWVNAVRFLQQFEIGHGDYTKERKEFLPRWDAKYMVRRARAFVRRGCKPRVSRARQARRGG